MNLAKAILAIGLILPSAVCSEGQESWSYVLLPAREVNSIPVRRRGETFKRTDWKPKTADIAGLEASLSQVAGLDVEGWNSNVHIDNPEKYFRQYLAVKLGEQDLIYVTPLAKNHRSHGIGGYMSLLTGPPAIGKRCMTL